MKIKTGIATTEFWVVLAYLAGAFTILERTWITSAISGLVVIAYVLSRAFSKKEPGVKHQTFVR